MSFIRTIVHFSSFTLERNPPKFYCNYKNWPQGGNSGLPKLFDFFFFFFLSPSLKSCHSGRKDLAILKNKDYSALFRFPVLAQRLTNLTSICEDEDSIPGLLQWVKDLALP